jgi:Uma2 family endonuclease
VYFGGRSIVTDVAMFTWDRIPLEESGDVANVFRTYPDWTIEILSPVQPQQKSLVTFYTASTKGVDWVG